MNTFLLQITVHVQTTGVRMVGVAQNAGVEVTGVVVRGVGVANIVTKVSTWIAVHSCKISTV